VVDGESKDRTAEIARSKGARVVSTTNKSNFHINKQMAMDEAAGDIIVQLDADEVVDAELQAFISDLGEKQKNGTLPEQPVAWYLRRRNFFLGHFLRKGGQYPDPVIRVYLRGKARLPQKNVHEQMEVMGETATAAGHLLHYAFPDFYTYMRKFNTYTSFEAERLHSTGIVPSSSKTIQYWLVKPVKMFFLLFLRHKGFVDGFPGFAYALMSSLHHPFTYLKLQEYFKK
jgi:glycosyltransferase involved in cell wall biosynthesis